MRGEFWTNTGTYEVSVSDSGVSLELEVGIVLPSLMIGPPSVERGVPSGPVQSLLVQQGWACSL